MFHRVTRQHELPVVKTIPFAMIAGCEKTNPFAVGNAAGENNDHWRSRSISSEGKKPKIKRVTREKSSPKRFYLIRKMF